MGRGQQRTCSCGEILIMPVTEDGNRTPVSIHPNPEGRVAVWQDAIGAYHCRIVTPSKPRQRGEVLHMTHFAECPHADRYRDADKRKADKDKPKRRRGEPVVADKQGTLF